MSIRTKLLAAPVLALTLAGPTMALAQSIPSVIITLENGQPSRGVFLTPPWIGIHDGTFDTYNGGDPADVPLGGDEVERLAEDGDNASITATFDSATNGGPQATVLGPGGPLAPGDRAAVTLNVDPAIDRYFSYASMIIPSNDAFAANGNPLAHQLFDDSGRFVGTDFIVSGEEINDAGTEVNDEIAGNVAFLNQTAPDTGVDENGVVVAPHPGFLDPAGLTYPDGVLNHPVFANGGQFNDPASRVLVVGFQFVDLGGRVLYSARLTTDAEVQADPVDSTASGSASLSSRGAETLRIDIDFRRTTGPLTMAHLHLGQAGTNGPIVVDMSAGIRRDIIRFTATAADLTGPLAGGEMLDLLNELAAGNIYVNLHTDAFPGGELRGQVGLRDD